MKKVHLNLMYQYLVTIMNDMTLNQNLSEASGSVVG
jgi:hypothetical protein